MLCDTLTGAVGVGGDVEARRPSMLDAVKSAWRLHKLQCLIFTMLCAASQVRLTLHVAPH
jgi:hypothetical protein